MAFRRGRFRSRRSSFHGRSLRRRGSFRRGRRGRRRFGRRMLRPMRIGVRM